MTAATSTPSRARRVLIVGSARYEMVGDCYRRALAKHYEVRIADPLEITKLTPPRWTKLPVMTVNRMVYVLSSVVLRDAFALALPGIVRAANEFAPDIVIVTPIDAIPPATVRALRGGNASAKVFGVFSDSISNFGRGHFFLADYDALFFKDRYVVDKLRSKLGWRHAFYLPQACDPEVHRPADLDDRERAIFGADLTIAGNTHAFRAAQLAPLMKYDLKIWGARPPRWLDHPIVRCHQSREVFGADKSRAMCGAKIVVNANHYTEIAGTNKRTFEVAAMGAFQLTDTPALADVFQPDEEVASYDTAADLIEKVDHYLARPEERARMAARARDRALREHTYAHRWTAHMEAMNITVPADFPVQPRDLAVRAT